jgi:hypothetical protein
MWNAKDVCIDPELMDVTDLAERMYAKTCRTNFEQPGFCLIRLGHRVDSVGLRNLMWELKERLARLHESTAGKTVVFESATRFDQQQSTKLHRDGGPKDSLLMLGYEPSDVASSVTIADYSRCAHDMGLSPETFMAMHNPMFPSGASLLLPYTTVLPCFDHREYLILFINNSCNECEGDKWQGVLHAASIPLPNESKRRVINSTMLFEAPRGTTDTVTEEEQTEFRTTTAVKRRGYDKINLEDDS